MKRFAAQYELYIVTEYRKGCVYKTKQIGTVFIQVGKRDEAEEEIRRKYPQVYMIQPNTKTDTVDFPPGQYWVDA